MVFMPLFGKVVIVYPVLMFQLGFFNYPNGKIAGKGSAVECIFDYNALHANSTKILRSFFLAFLPTGFFLFIFLFLVFVLFRKPRISLEKSLTRYNFFFES